MPSATNANHRVATVGSDNQLIVHEIEQSQLEQATEAEPIDEAAGQTPIVIP